jgi:hypothetical protein
MRLFMKTPLPCAFLVVAVGLSMCSREGEKSISVQAVPILSVKVPEIIRSGDSLTVEVMCGTPTPCWEYQRFEVSFADSVISVAVFAQYDGRPCIQTLGTFSAKTVIRPPGPGRYHFQFKQEEGKTLAKTLTVR